MQYNLIHLLKRDNHTRALVNKMENWLESGFLRFTYRHVIKCAGGDD